MRVYWSLELALRACFRSDAVLYTIDALLDSGRQKEAHAVFLDTGGLETLQDVPILRNLLGSCRSATQD